MGHQELEAALRRDGESKAREIWQIAEASAAQIRRETEELLQQLAESGAGRLALASAGLLEEALSTAQKQAMRDRLETEQRLAERLKALTKSRLPELALRGGTRLFHMLANEIPAADWHLIKVNERDAQAAKDRFPNAEVIVSESICGGLVVENAQATVIIINTLEKRLEHLWPELLPGLLAQLRTKGKGHETAGGT